MEKEKFKETQQPFTVFYLYAPEDEELCKSLENHLAPLRRQNIIVNWSNRQITPGVDQEGAINTHLATASIILLLVSPDFFKSDYCNNIMYRALERHEGGKAYVIPIILRPVDKEGAPFAHLQHLPRNGKPITLWSDRDSAFFEIATSIREITQNLQELRIQRSTVSVSNESDHDRENLLKRVMTFWIDGVLMESLHQVAPITLSLQEQADAVVDPWPIRPSFPLPFGKPIIRVYDEASGELLILGEPGAGKTTLLLELAHDLLVRADHDEQHPIPTVFNLSSWAVERRPLAVWLSEELHSRYKIPLEKAQAWISANKILPLLDGLDEVDSACRTMCIAAINGYHKEHDSVPLVVSSRKSEYVTQKTKLELRRAVLIQSLTTHQIDDYLSRVGNQMRMIREALHRDSKLQQLMTTPLMLSILILAYQDSSVEDLVGAGSLETLRHRVFERFVERMLTSRRTQTNYPIQRAKHWLSWLAKQMKQRNQTVFYIASIQPDWIPRKGWRSAARGWREVAIWANLGFEAGAAGAYFGGKVGGGPGALVGALTGVLGAGLLTKNAVKRGERKQLKKSTTIPAKNIDKAAFSENPLLRHKDKVLIYLDILGNPDLLLILWRLGVMPWPIEYPKFLNYAVEHNLLYRIGNGYIFIHQLLLDYFASLELSSISNDEQ